MKGVFLGYVFWGRDCGEKWFVQFVLCKVRCALVLAKVGKVMEEVVFRC